MIEQALPNFFIVGTGKAGTTSLYHYLRQHPQIYMSPLKEPCYFASEICAENLAEDQLSHIRRMSRRLPESLNDSEPDPYGWLVKDWTSYLQLFRDVRGETAIGEASVVYLWSETAANNIEARMPDAKIVIILRNPAERAFSQYLHQLTMGMMRSTFREHLENCVSNRGRKFSIYHPFLEVGLYHAQIERYLQLFPRNNIRIYWYEEAWKEPSSFLRDLFEFLAVDAAFCPDLTVRSLERRAPRFGAFHFAAKQFEATHRLNDWIPPQFRTAIRRVLFRRRGLTMDPDDRKYLVDYYRDDILKLGSLVNRDLSIWLS